MKWAASVFALCLAVYLANGRPRPEVDCVAAPYEAWALVRHGQLDPRQDLRLCQPHPAIDQRVFFAGEHLCVLHGWMQSAIQSALEAVMGVMDAP